MKSLNVLSVVAALIIVSADMWLIKSALSASPEIAAPPGVLFTPQLQSSPPATRPMTPDQVARETWRKSMSQSQTQIKGCAKAVYPRTEWQEIPCTTAPKEPIGRPPPHAKSDEISPLIVGNSNDFVAVVSGTMTTATGSFGPGAGVVNETSKTTGQSNIFSLQLNTNVFNNPINTNTNPNTAWCRGITGCRGWQQYVFRSDGSLFIQYQLLFYGPNCPNGWTSYANVHCYINGPSTPVPATSITDLAQLRLQADDASGGSDTATLSTSSELYRTAPNGNFLGLATTWKQAEFNVFGIAAYDQANFNQGAIIRVNIKVNGTSGLGAISCLGNGGTTGETSNLILGTSCYAGVLEGSPQISFGESSAPSVTSITPNFGSEDGKTKVEVLGAGFLASSSEKGTGNGTEIGFGSVYVGADCDSTTHCVAFSPRGTGVVPLTAGNYTVSDVSVFSPLNPPRRHVIAAQN